MKFVEYKIHENNNIKITVTKGIHIIFFFFLLENKNSKKKSFQKMKIK